MPDAAGRAIPVQHHESLDGTNAEALRQLAAGDRGLRMIVAREQTAGRGRDGRIWTSPRGGLYATIVAEAPAGRPVAELAFVAALAAGGAILAVCPDIPDLRYKWPNDVLVGGRKLAGVLIEGDGSGGLAIGIGINVESAPAKAVWPATCLHAEGCGMATVDAVRDALVETFAERFATWQADGFAPVRSAWLDRAYGLGRNMRARMPDGAIYDGVFAALEEDGALVMDLGAAGMRRIAAGEIMAGAV
jgi:BirA family biotin operon repressor/biotin-[acetyl-CoA-carboxylase] ligase